MSVVRWSMAGDFGSGGEVGAAGPASNTMMIMVTAPVSVATYAIIAGEVAIAARRRPP